MDKTKKTRSFFKWMLPCIIVFAAVLLLCLSLTMPTSAAERSGTCGENVTWTLRGGVLTIEGQGEMTNYDYEESPWYEDLTIKKVIIKDGVTHIGTNTFSQCSGITEISLPKSVTTMGFNAFARCSVSLQKIIVDPQNPVLAEQGNCLILKSRKTLLFGCRNSVIPTDGSVTIIGSSSFVDCYGLTEITIPETITEIESAAFAGCGLTKVVIPESVTKLGTLAFYQCTDLAEVVIPKSITKIEDNTFQACSASLQKITVDPQNPVYTVKGNCLIDKTNRTLILGCVSSVIPADGSVTSIGNSAFWRCEPLTKITIPETVTSIGEYAFVGCYHVPRITIPKSVTNIGRSAFWDCGGLKNTYYPGTEEEWKTKVQVGEYNLCLTDHLIFGSAEPDFLLGDVNDDGKVNAADRTYLARTLANWSGYIVSLEKGDVNRDGKVNAADRTYLARALANWSGYSVE